MTVTFSFKFFFAPSLISQRLPSGIQQEPRSTSKAFRVTVCTEVQNEMAHPSAPFCNPVTRMSNYSLFPKKQPWETTSAYSYLSFIPPLQGQLSAGGKELQPQALQTVSTVQKEGSAHLGWTQAVPRTGTASGNGFSLPPHHPSPKDITKGSRNGK